MLRFTISPPAALKSDVVDLPRWVAHPSAVPSSSSSSGPAWATLRLHHRPWAVTVGLRAGERVAGLGATNRGQADRRGQSFRGVNLDTIFYGIPGGTYGSFPLAWLVDPSAPGTVRAVAVLSARPLDVIVDADGAVGELRFVDVDPAWEGAVDVLAFEGSPSAVMAEIRSVFGAACVPPPWAFGFHQSRWSYRTADDVKDVVEGARAADVPLDVVHLDIHMMDAYQVFTWHPDRFPDPAGLHRWLDARGVRTMAIVDPGVSTANDLAQHLEEADGLLTTSTGKPYHGKVWPGTTVFPDFGQETVRATWRDAHKALTDVGVSAIWNDMNDPVFRVGVVHDPLAEDVWHAADVPADDDVDVLKNRRVPHIEKRNLYANEMATATQAALQGAAPTTRPFVLSRSGFLGIQQHAALWTGDNFSSWEQLEENLHMVMHLGLVGVPISGADIGGFGGRRGKYGIAKWRPPAELFVRWLELGALMPFCRVHSVLYGPRQEPWAFGGDVPRLAREILRRRMALLPTLLALAHTASTTGTPLVRPLWFHGPVPASSSTAADTSFMLGDDLLVAPVFHKGVDARTIYLPAGLWRHFLTGEVYGAGDDGAENGTGEGGVVDVTAPLGQTPIFVRSTTPLVLASGGARVAEALAGPVILEVLSPPSASEKEPERGPEKDAEQPQGLKARRGRSRVVIADGAGPTWLEVAAIHDDGDIVVHLSIEGLVPTERGLVWRLPPGFRTLRTPGGEDVSLETERVAADGRVVVCATSTTALVPGRYLAR